MVCVVRLLSYDSNAQGDMVNCLLTFSSPPCRYHALQKRHEATLQQLDQMHIMSEAGSSPSMGRPSSTSGAEAATRMQQQLHSLKAELTQYKQTLDHERAEHAEEVGVQRLF